MTDSRPSLAAAAAAFCAALACAALPAAAQAQTVKVTPLGGIDGELCAQDRALVFEDPNGTRILYDPGRTVAGATDPRLGKIDVILVTHMHGDHVGNAHAKAPDSGTCGEPDMSVSAMPNTNTVNIALAKKSKIVTGSEMPPFFATGYVLRFSNGLVAYLSGDTGVTADQERVVRDLYQARLAVMNIGDGFTTGPLESAFVMNELVKPASVIASHVNEVGTVGGKVRPGSKTEAFMKLAKMPVHLPLSGRTMAFDATGKCVAGC